MNMTLMIIATIIFLMTLMFMNMKETKENNKDKKTSFECGFNQMAMKKMTFSTNFILIAMMFLIFDVEISFLIPSIMSNKNKMMMMSLTLMFLIILTIILMKEWKQGSLEWNK